jgi:hypothetical protein
VIRTASAASGAGDLTHKANHTSSLQETGLAGRIDPAGCPRAPVLRLRPPALANLEIALPDPTGHEIADSPVP